MRTRLPGMRVRAATALAAAALATAAAGCGSLAAPGAASGGAAGSGGTAGAPAPGSGSPGSTAPGPGAACSDASLHVKLDVSAAGVAGGTTYVPLDFTNTSPRPCELTGYPAVALTSGLAGRQIGTEAAVDHSVRPAAVLLAPGATAHAWIGIGDAANFPAGSCRPVTAAGFRVVVPGSEVSSYLAHKVPACRGSAHRDMLIIQPVQPGAARRGSA